MIAGYLDSAHLSAFLSTARRIFCLLDFLLYERAPNHVCAYGDSVLEWAARNGREAVIRKLFKRSHDAWFSVQARSKALFLAAEAGIHCVIEVLAANGANFSSAIDIGCGSLCIPLQVAAGNGHEETVRLLLKLGADIDAVDEMKDTALNYAIQGGHLNIVKLLLEEGATLTRLNKYDETPLHDAVISGNESIVDLLLENGLDLEATQSFGETALHYAVDRDVLSNQAILDLLLKRGANIGAKSGASTDGPLLTPLHYAARNGNERYAKSLLTNGASVTACDSIRRTPLHLAAETGNEALIRLLLDNGADPTALALFERTPQECAKLLGHKKVAVLLGKAARNWKPTQS